MAISSVITVGHKCKDQMFRRQTLKAQKIDDVE